MNDTFQNRAWGRRVWRELCARTGSKRHAKCMVHSVTTDHHSIAGCSLFPVPWGGRVAAMGNGSQIGRIKVPQILLAVGKL